MKLCVKCGKPAPEGYQAYNKPLCKLCASWFGYMMINIRRALSKGTAS